MTELKRTTEHQHPLGQLSLMRLRIFVREPAALFWTYGFPLLLALVLGTAFRNRPPEPVDVAVVAAAGTEDWREALARTPAVQVHSLNAQEAREALRAGKVSLVVEGGRPRTYQFDPTRPESRLARVPAGTKRSCAPRQYPWLNKSKAVIAISKAIYKKRLETIKAPLKQVIYNGVVFSDEIPYSLSSLALNNSVVLITTPSASKSIALIIHIYYHY